MAVNKEKEKKCLKCLSIFGWISKIENFRMSVNMKFYNSGIKWNVIWMRVGRGSS